MVTSASVTIRWNTSPPAHTAPAEAAVPARVAHATVLAVRGNVVTLRLSDGTRHAYRADDAQAKALRGLIGQSIAFRAGR